MTRLRAFWEYLRGTYWAVPSAMAAAAVILSVGMVQLDRATTADLVSRLSWVYTGGPEGARAVLSTIAGSMITVAGVTFSITIVALTLASQQFGPRLLRNFLRDLGNQIVLGTFVSTYLYCLLVLRTIRGTDDTEFVPHLAVTLGVVLAMLSLGVLIFFIHHVATSIQASQIIAKVAHDLEAAAARLFPERIGGGNPGGPDAWQLEAGIQSRAICATRAGYVQAIDSDGVMARARSSDVLLRFHVRPGSFVQPGELIMTVYAPAFSSDWTGAPFGDLVIVGAERTGTQDIEFFFNQLVELAVRALSPGINDPATARSCIDRLEQALSGLSCRRFPDAVRYDENGTMRVLVSRLTWSTLVASAFDEIGRYGASSVSVTSRLLEALGAIARRVQGAEDREAVLAQATALIELSHSSKMSSRDRAHLDARYEAVLCVRQGTR